MNMGPPDDYCRMKGTMNLGTGIMERGMHDWTRREEKRV